MTSTASDITARPDPGATPPQRLRLVSHGAAIDVNAAAQAVRALLLALGQDPDSEHLHDTPRRVAAAYTELLTPRPFTLTTFPNEESYDQLVVVRDIAFQSLCQHHLLPFQGIAHVGYLPEGHILGLSKLARVVEHFARGLQVQERLTQQVADCLHEHLQPKGVGVVVHAEHQCMSIRGVRAHGSHTITSALRGQLRNDPATRQEFLSLTRSAT